MATYTILEKTLDDIANAIRTKRNYNESLTPLEMPQAILGIEGSGGGGSTNPDDPFHKAKVQYNLYGNESGVHTAGTGNYSSTETVIDGVIAQGITEIQYQKFLRKTSDNAIWPINNYYGKWVNGHKMRIVFYVWCSEGTVGWNNNNIYVNSNFTYVHNLNPITTTPQLVDFTFTYEDSGSQYEPTIHIYPNHDVNSGIDLFVTPLLVIDEDEAKTTKYYYY